MGGPVFKLPFSIIKKDQENWDVQVTENLRMLERVLQRWFPNGYFTIGSKDNAAGEQLLIELDENRQETGNRMKIGPAGIYFSTDSGKTWSTFINGNTITSPVIAGNNGRFSGEVKVGTDNNLAGVSGLGVSADSIRFWAGNATKTDAPFKVLQDGTMRASQGEFGGDVRVGGKLLVGTNGVLSIFQFVSVDERNGWGHFGIVDLGGDLSAGRVQVTASIPSNFTITKATITLEAMPVYYENVSAPSNNGWKQSRNLKLYQADGDEGFLLWVQDSSWYPPYWRNGTDITNTAFGISSWSPTLTYSGTDDTNTQNKIQRRVSGDIKTLLTAGRETTFYVETTDTPNQTNADVNKGLGRIIVVIEGYAAAS